MILFYTIPSARSERQHNQELAAAQADPTKTVEVIMKNGFFGPTKEYVIREKTPQ
jgi:topoisomerase IA-like protein